jgi:putative ABC transport system permease protein
MEELIRDLRYSFRSLGNSPRFTLIAVLTLSVGIGANTSIFSVVNGVLLKELPYGEPDRLVRVRTVMTDGRATAGGISPLEQHAIRQDFASFTAVTSTYPYDITVLDAEERPIRTNSYAITEQFFETFGIPLYMGRDFLPVEFESPDNLSVILGYQLWRDVYGSDPEIIGKTIPTTEVALPVVGVAPPGFDYPDGANIWFSLPHSPAGTNHGFQGVARLSPGAAIQRAEGELAVLASRLEEEFPGANRGRGFRVTSLRDEIIGDMRSTLIILMGATATLLLIACANVVNLLLSRGAVRAKEVALRAALGASRGRLFSGLLIESLVLAGAGAALGLGSSWVALKVLLSLGPESIPRLDEVGMDLNVLLFTVAITGMAAVLFGLVPAVRLVGTELRTLIGDASRGSSGGPGQGRFLKVSVMAQMGLAAVLVTGSGLLVRSYARLVNTDTGFDSNGVLTVDVALPWNAYPYFREVHAFYNDATERIRQLPGVETVGAISTIPMGPQMDGWTAHYVVGQPRPESGEGDRLRIRKVIPNFFEAMDVPLIKGRYLNAADVFDNRGVAVINEAAARLMFPGEDPIGQRLHRFLDAPTDSTGGPFGWNSKIEVEVVGVIADVKYRRLNEPADPAVYQPHSQVPWRRMTLTVETDEANPSGLSTAIREAIWAVDPNLALIFETQEGLVSRSLARETLGMMLLSMFAFSALILATVGIYGVISYAVSQRTTEMAIRASLGLAPTGILAILLKEGGILAAGGVGSGIIIALLGRRVIASQLYEISAADPLVFVTVPLILLAVGLAAIFLPARKATRLNLAAVLRQE